MTRRVYGFKGRYWMTSEFHLDSTDDSFFYSSAPVDMVDTIKAPLYVPSPRVLAIVNSALPQIAPESGMAVAGGKAVQLRHLLVLELPGGKAWDAICHEAYEDSK
jgi:hypothetical protein